jgi:CBS domain-containing protein
MQRMISGILDAKGTDVWTVGPHDTVLEALQLMADQNVGAVVVVDGDDLVGILTERDYARKVALTERRAQETPVEDVMTTDIYTVTLSETVAGCMETMTERRIRHLPVMVDGRLAGLVSIGDIVKATLAQHRDLIAQLEHYITS